MNDHYYALILAGGGGTRLWPKSREKTPKQCLKLGGEKTLLRFTAERVLKIVDWDHMYIITNQAQLKDVVEQLPEVPTTQIIAEPEKRETALAMGIGAMLIQEKDPDAIIMNFGSDHTVEDEKEFVRVMKASAKVAEDFSHLVAVGIPPTFPHTGLGYIRIGDEVGTQGDISVFKVEKFREKPNLATAKAFLATGKYFWNANNYTWSAVALEQAFRTYAPQIAETIDSLRPLVRKPNFDEAMKKAYASAESISIDYAISEKVDNLLLLPGDFGWNDIGDWKVVYDLGNKDGNGNVILRDNTDGELIEYGAKNNLVYLNGRLIALVDVKDIVVVDTKDVLLVMPKEQSQDVKKLVSEIKELGKKQYL